MLGKRKYPGAQVYPRDEPQQGRSPLEREGWIGGHGGGHDVYKHPSKPGRIVVARHRTL